MNPLLILVFALSATCQVVTVTETVTQAQTLQTTDGGSYQVDASGNQAQDGQLLQDLSQLVMQLKQRLVQQAQPTNNVFSSPQVQDQQQQLDVVDSLRTETVTQTVPPQPMAARTIIMTVTQTVPVPVVPSYTEKSQWADRLINYLRAHAGEIKGELGNIIRAVIGRYDDGVKAMQKQVCLPSKSQTSNDWGEMTARQARVAQYPSMLGGPSQQQQQQFVVQENAGTNVYNLPPYRIQ